MTVYLDDEPMACESRRLDEILAAATQRLSDDGRVVVEVRVGDEPVTDQQLEQQDQVEVDDDVRLYSADRRELTAAVLRQTAEHLGELQEMQSSAAELFQRDQAVEALEKVAATLQIWAHVQQAVVQSAALNDLKLDEVRVDGEPVGPRIAELRDKLEQLKELLAASDVVGLADSLQYEWPEVVERWQTLLHGLAEHIENDA